MKETINLAEPTNTPLRSSVVMLCMMLPWLNPIALRPSANVLALLLSWGMAASLFISQVKRPFGGSPVSKTDWVIGMGLLAWLAASLLWVPPVMNRMLTMGLIASLMCIWLMVAVGRRAAANEELLRWLVHALLIAAVISSILGILQYFGMAAGLFPWVSQPLKGEAFANLRQRNLFASLTSLGLVALLAYVDAQSKIKALPRSTWLFVLLLLNVLAAGLACSASRTGALEWVAVGMCMALWARRRAQEKPEFGKGLMWLAIAAPILALVWAAVMPWLALQFTDEWGVSVILRFAAQGQDNMVCASRRVLWRNIFTVIIQHPWLGWGWGETAFAHFLTPYAGMKFCGILDNAHNLPLHLALELGIPFAVALMVCAAAWVLRRKPWRERNMWRMMAWCMLWVVGLHSLVEYPLWYGPFQMTFGLAVGLLWAAPHQPAVKHASKLQMLGALVLGVGCIYAAWDFRRVGQIFRPPALRSPAYQEDPLQHAKQSWLFDKYAAFAELTLQSVTAENAPQIYPLALRVMHYSPEPQVVQRAIESAHYLGYEMQAKIWTQRLATQQQKTAP